MKLNQTAWDHFSPYKSQSHGTYQQYILLQEQTFHNIVSWLITFFEQ